MAKKVILIGDFLKDLDDEHALCGAAGLVELGLLEILCVIGNLSPAEKRARAAKGTLDLLGLKHIPVGVGMPVNEVKSFPYEKVPYLADPDSIYQDGLGLLIQTLSLSDPKSVTLVLQSGLTDAAVLIAAFPKLCEEKLEAVAIMGGVETTLSSEGLLVPNNANNNTFDFPSSQFLYRQLQLMGIPMIITTKEVAYMTKVPFSVYDRLTETGNPIGYSLRERQRPSLQHLWKAACAPKGSEVRGSLPEDRNRRWYVETFCGNVDPPIDHNGDIWPYLATFNLYDPINLYAAIPEIRDVFLTPVVFKILGVEHLVFGLSKENHGVVDPKGFIDFMVDIEVLGLS